MKRAQCGWSFRAWAERRRDCFIISKLIGPPMRQGSLFPQQFYQRLISPLD